MGQPIIVNSRPWYTPLEEARVAEALHGRTSGDGPFGRRAEQRLEALLGVPHVLLTTSCTHAMELALLALGIGPGHEVIVPSFTFVSTANAVLRAGAVPVLADIEETTLGLDAADAARRIGPKTAAIMVVPYAGVAPDMDALSGLAREHGLRLIEDAAQGLGARWQGRPLGTLGDAGCFSFHDTKNVSCGEGGALVLRDPDVAARAEIIREKGTNRAAFLRGEVDKYTWVAQGSSYVLSDLLAAVLDAQLERIDEIQAARARVVTAYREALSEWARRSGVRLFDAPAGREPNHHIYWLLFPDGPARDRALEHLRARGVQATFHYVPLHESPAGQRLARIDGPLPVAESVASRLLRLPLHPLLDEAQIARVVEAVTELGGA